MEDEFPSMFIGDNTLAAIDIAENTEKSKHSGINFFKKDSCKHEINYVNLNKVMSPSNYREVEKRKESNHEEIICSEKNKIGLDEYQSASENYSHKHEVNLITNVSPTEEGSSKSEFSQTTCESMDQKEFSSKTSKCSLEDWGLPAEILKEYKKMGVKNMFQWQVECLSNECVLSGKNLVYSAPTSAGKTLVAELLTIKTILERKKKAIIILPFVSVVIEKTSHFQALLERNGIRVEGFMGGYSPLGGFQRTDIAICTIEKANSLINRLMEDGSLNTLGIVVVDELHLLGDAHRGYLLELLLTKIRYMCARDRVCIQVVGMSATLPNLELLANWLHAELYQTDFRPVPLREFVKFGKTIYDKNMKLVSKVNLNLPIQGDSDDLTFLCLETIAQGFSVLVFCPTKNWCEKLAETIARSFYSIGNKSASFAKEEKEIVDKFIDQLNKSSLPEVLERLKRSPVGLDSILAKTVAFGVAFHHAGLTMDEREILEASFRSGSLRVLVATSTLSSGVNLPARRVIIRTPLFHGQLLDILTYRQMIGRAGRMGVDTAGESILVCHEKERGMVERLLNSDLPPIQSCLGGEKSSKLTGSLKRAIFEVVASGVACSPEDIESYANFTLLMASMKRESTVQMNLHDPLKACIKYLEENEFIRLKETGEDGKVKYVATHLGEACLAASLPPDQALALFEELQRARKCFVLEDELHIVYQVTPFSVADQWGSNLDWLHMLNIWQSLPPSMQRVGELVGVEERFMVRAMRGSLNTRAPKQMEKMAIHRRFYTALALQELANEVPLSDVAQKYGCSRGMLQNLQQSSATFAGMVTQFCHRLRWGGLELLASQFQDRLQFGIRRELCDLMRLPMLDGQCARALFDAGIETLAMLAVDTSPEKIDEALRAYIPFQSGKNKEACLKDKDKWTSMCGSVRYLLGKNPAFSLIEEARKILQKDLGIAEMKWKSNLEEEAGNVSFDDKLANHEKQVPCQQKPSESNSVVVNSTSASLDHGETEDHSDSSNALITNTDSCVPAESEDIHDSACNISKITKMEKFSPKVCKPDQRNYTIEKPEDELEISQIKLDADSVKDVSDVCKKRESITAPKHCVRDSPATPPVSSFILNHSGRSNGCNRIKRRSIDIFSSPVGEEFSIPNTSERSPSLFGDSFTIDTQLGSLLDGSSGSNKVNLSSSANGVRLSEGENTKQCFVHSSNDSDLKVTKISPLSKQSTPSNTSKPFPVINRLKFNENSPLNTSSPRARSMGYPGKIESLEICVAQGALTPGGWDFGTVYKVEDSYVESTCALDATYIDPCKPNQETGVKGDIGEEKLAVNENDKNLSVDTYGSSFLEKAFTSAFDFEENFNIGVEDAQYEVDSKEGSFLGEGMEHNVDTTVERIEVWGSHVQNCSMEAIHHSIVGAPHSDEEDNDMIVSSQGDKLMVSGINFVKHMHTMFSYDEAKENKDNTRAKSEIILKRPGVFEQSTLHDVLPLESNDESARENDGSPAKVFANNSKGSYSEVDSFNIIDVCKDFNLFKVFCEELELQKRFSFSVAASRTEKTCDNCNADCEKVGDGHVNSTSMNSMQLKLLNKRKMCNADSEIGTFRFRSVGSLLDVTTKVDGISFSWGDNNVYFMSLNPSKDKGNLLIPSHHDRVTFLKRMFESIKTMDKTCIAVDLKEHLKALIVGCDVLPIWNCRYWDPKIADWLLHPTGHEKNLRNMCLAYCSELWKLLEACGGSGVARSGWAVDFDAGNGVPSRLFSAIEALIALKCMSKLESLLQRENLFSVFTEFEMLTAFCLVQMEALGVGFSELQGNAMKLLLLSKMQELEKKAYMLAGHPFKISSPAEVGKVLYRELRLPCMDSKNSSNTRFKKKWSTSKESLEKLTSIHRLPRVLLEWRKINSILNKTVHPLLGCCRENRIFGMHIMHTATGRISMHEPNLQNIPRNFEILSLISEQEVRYMEKHDRKEENLPEKDNTLSIRHCFIPAKGFVFLSADYSQLELRIMAHLSKDEKLCLILNKGSDVFTTIASLWKNIDATKVTPNVRQQAKKICYGILYGIGCKSLAQQLEVEDDEALNFMETFKNSFPGLKAFLTSTVEQCRSDGYVRTMRGRKRELPNISSSNPTLKAQAERQAVNTVVQGSAADLVKTAMVCVGTRLRTRFPPLGYRSPYHNLKSSSCSTPSSKRPRVDGSEGTKETMIDGPAGAILVLHLHDELLYEVAEHDLDTVVHIVQSEMEAAWKISVNLPVNLKVGDSWGALRDY